MSDFARPNTGGATHFGDKDALSTLDSAKVIVGSQFDTEFNALVAPIASKYDSTDIASSAQAIATSSESDAVLMTPLKVKEWSDANGGVIGDLWPLADPGADRILFWDNSATVMKFLNPSTGLTISGTNMTVNPAGVDHDTLSNYVADQHVAHSGVTVTAGTGLTGGGAIDSSFTLNVGAGDGITVAANSVALTAAAATTSNPISVAAGVIDIDVTALTNIEGSALNATDEILVDNGGTPKAMAIQDIGHRVITDATATRSLVAADMNAIIEFSHATPVLTLPLNTTTDLPVGVPVILNMKHATATLTIQAATSVTLVSIFHPAGTSAASDTLLAGGTALLYKSATNTWVLTGNTTT